MLKLCIGIVRRDLLLAMRRKAGMATPLAFYIMVASLFPLAVGADPDPLRQMGPGVVWVAALLAALLGLDRLFAHDDADGVLEQLLLAPVPLAAIALAKACAHWLVAGLPLVLVTPILAIQYDLQADVAWVVVLGLLIGTPVLSLVGAIGAALALRTRGGSVLVALILVPLYIPVLILGAGAARLQAQGLGGDAFLLLLGAMALAAAALAPWAAAAALRAALD